MTKKNVIVTYSQAKDDVFKNITVTRFKNYATKCDADFLEIKWPEDQRYTGVAKMLNMSKDIPKKYQRMLILDVDTLVRKDSPNLFDLVPSNQIGLYNEVAMYQCQDYIYGEPINFRYGVLKHLVDTCKLEKIKMPDVFNFGDGFSYFNTGVMLYNKKALAHHDEFSDKQIKLMGENDTLFTEQVAINYLIRKHQQGVYHLPVAFNQMLQNKYTDYLKTSFFLHYANMDFDAKTEAIKADHAAWNSCKV